MQIRDIVCFILGIAAGIAWYKFYIIYTVDRFSNTACDYCRFMIQKQELKKFFSRKT